MLQKKLIAEIETWREDCNDRDGCGYCLDANNLFEEVLKQDFTSAIDS